MVTHLQKIRLGIFFVVSVAVILATVIIIVTPKLFETKDIYYIGYRDISLTGLQEGSAVKYHGLTVGNVSDISIDPKDIRRVIVEVSLDAGIPIKEDTYADITMLGITGLKVIEFRGGSNEAESLKPGDFITPGKSVTEIITGKAEVIAEKAEMALNNLSSFTSAENRTKILDLIERTSSTMAELNEILRTNKHAFARTMDNSQQITTEVQTLLLQANETLDYLDTFTRSDSLKQVLGNLVEITENLKEAELVSLVEEFTTALRQTNSVLKEVGGTLAHSRTDLGTSIEALKESVEYLNQFSRLISEDPSVLIRGIEPRDAPDYRLEEK